MSDPNLADFYGRVARIERARAKGYGFESNGRSGRSHYLRATRQRRPLLRVLIFAFVCVFGLNSPYSSKAEGIGCVRLKVL